MDTRNASENFGWKRGLPVLPSNPQIDARRASEQGQLESVLRKGERNDLRAYQLNDLRVKGRFLNRRAAYRREACAVVAIVREAAQVAVDVH